MDPMIRISLKNENWSDGTKSQTLLEIKQHSQLVRLHCIDAAAAEKIAYAIRDSINAFTVHTADIDD